MSKSLFLMFAVLCLLLLGCSKSETTTNRDSTAPANKNAPAMASPAATTSASSGQKTGVAACDDFIAAYEACVNDKVPAAARAQFKTSVAQWRKSWHDLAANPQTKATLPQVCKTTAEQARKSMKAYGCTF
jgi:hypothetical protein